MRLTNLLVLAVAATAVDAAVLQPRDACSNGIRICGYGSVSCSGNTCVAKNSDGRQCTLQAPYDHSCGSQVPCVNFDTCSTGSKAVSSAKPATSTKTTAAATKATATKAAATTTAAAKQTSSRQSFADYLRKLFGGR